MKVYRPDVMLKQMGLDILPQIQLGAWASARYTKTWMDAYVHYRQKSHVGGWHDNRHIFINDVTEELRIGHMRTHKITFQIPEIVSMMDLTTDPEPHGVTYGSQPEASHTLPSRWKWILDCDRV